MDDIKQKIKEIDEYTKNNIKPSRYKHSKRVAKMCVKLCRRYSLDVKKGYLIGIGHDMCKYLPDEQMIETASRDGQPITEEEKKAPMLLHGRAAAVIMKEKFNIDDEQLLEAVANHVSGKIRMCDYTKILFLADKCEPKRPQSTKKYRNNLMKLSLDGMTASVLQENYEFLLKKGYSIYPNTKKMIQYYTEKAGKEGN
ncbi:MAG: bis(5'-nucleosyl)-tetraphosphatase (symmetrical) YqeK [Treponema sp.]|nr:bis(5'-nucleosyl)-tetraphosphatase (symmetrical) YqeK [Treponema sp.]